MVEFDEGIGVEGVVDTVVLVSGKVVVVDVVDVVVDVVRGGGTVRGSSQGTCLM